MKPMSTAPRDGTRILIQTVTFGWNSDICQNVQTGTKWVEARWASKMGMPETWVEWCGNERTSSTDSLTPLGWADRPSDEVDLT